MKEAMNRCFNLSGEIPQVAAGQNCRERGAAVGFNLSGEIPQVAARAAFKCPGPPRLSFNLSGEIPQVAARRPRLRWGSSRQVSISQARFLKWPHGQRATFGAIEVVFQSLRRDSSSGRLTSPSLCRMRTVFQSLRRDSSSGRMKRGEIQGIYYKVSISQARFLKWPPVSSFAIDHFQDSFNLSGEIPQVAARGNCEVKMNWTEFQSLRRDSSSGRTDSLSDSISISVCFNLSGEIPQVAASLDSGVDQEAEVVSISQARFLKWPRAGFFGLLL